MSIENDILNGDLKAAGRLMRDLDAMTPTARRVLKHLFPHTGHAHVVGITGPPGVGKSSLISGLIPHYRNQGKTLGVLMVDPSSPFSRGAVLGDRIRMQHHAMDEGVFIHSIASHGNTGGLSASVPGIIAVLDAMRKDIILIETVGAGQDDVDVLHISHTNIVVVTPAMGDAMQTIKAGILETAHIFALNKSDQSGATTTYQMLQMITQVKHTADDDWISPVIQTQAVHQHGMVELADQIDRHGAVLTQTRHDKQVNTHLRGLLTLILREQLMDRLRSEMNQNDKWQDLIDRLHQRQIDPYSAADEVLNEITP
jgi:GTPase